MVNHAGLVEALTRLGVKVNDVSGQSPHAQWSAASDRSGGSPLGRWRAVTLPNTANVVCVLGAEGVVVVDADLLSFDTTAPVDTAVAELQSALTGL